MFVHCVCKPVVLCCVVFLLLLCVYVCVPVVPILLQYFHRGQALVTKGRYTNPSTSNCLFIQAFRQLNGLNPALLRAPPDAQKEFLFQVKFRTFNAQGRDEEEPGADWGGLYREALNSFVEDLFDPEALTLCTPVPNARNHVGATVRREIERVRWGTRPVGVRGHCVHTRALFEEGADLVNRVAAFLTHLDELLLLLLLLLKCVVYVYLCVQHAV